VEDTGYSDRWRRSKLAIKAGDQSRQAMLGQVASIDKTASKTRSAEFAESFGRREFLPCLPSLR
jgi:hypothetical protein